MSDDAPKRAVGTKQHRVNRAIHLHFTTELTDAEIGEKLGVTERTVKNYVAEPPADEVRETLRNQATQVRMAAFAELKRQLRAAGQRSRGAETPVKVWEGDDGALNVKDIEDDEGTVVKRVPLPADLVMGPDEEARFYARREAREVLEMLVDLVGAAEPEQIELSGEVDGGMSGELEGKLEELSESIDSAYGES